MKLQIKRVALAVLLSLVFVLAFAQAALADTGELVGNSTSHYSIEFPLQRKAFYAADRHWLFYTDGTTTGYRSSTDGSNWSDFTSFTGSADDGVKIMVFYDGTYLHSARAYTDSDILYRRGVPESDGTITWSAAEQTITGESGLLRSICVNSDGDPFIGYYNGTRPLVTKSSTNDGTWSTQAGFPYLLIDSAIYTALVVPLTDGNVYAIYARTGNPIRGKKWTDGTTTWGAQETVTTNYPSDSSAISATAYNGTIYFTYTQATAKDIRYIEYSEDSWGADSVIYDGSVGSSPVISLWNTDGDLRVFWIDDPTENHIYYLERTSESWDETPTDWITAGTLPNNYQPTVFYEKQSGIIGIAYVDGEGSPYNVNYAFLEEAVSPSVTTNAASGVGSTGATLNGEVTTIGDTSITDRGFDWDTDSGAPYTYSWTEEGSWGAVSFSHAITSLPAETTIYFRAKAQNDGVEEWGYGDELSFDTLETPVTPEATTGFTFIINLMQLVLPVIVVIGGVLVAVRGIAKGSPLTIMVGVIATIIALIVVQAILGAI